MSWRRVFVLLVAISRTHGTELTLRDCIDEAYGRSPALEAARFDLLAAVQEIVKQHAALLPSLSAEATVQLIDGSLVSPFAILHQSDLENGVTGIDTANTTTETTHITTQKTGKRIVTFTKTSRTATTTHFSRAIMPVDFGMIGTQRLALKYPLYQNGSILGLNDAPAVAGARAAKKQLEWTTKLAEEKVVFDLSTGFFTALWFQEKMKRDEARVEWSEQRLAITKAQFELELKLAQDVELAKSQLDADRRSLAATRESARDASSALALLIGRKPESQLVLDSSAPPLPELPVLTQFLTGVMAAHPAVAAQAGNVELARQKYLLNRAQLYPTVNFNSGFSVGENLAHPGGGDGLPRPTLFATVLQVDAPIFDFGERLAASRESREKIKAEQARTAQVDLDTRSAIAQLYSAIHDLDRTVASFEEALVQADNRAKLVRIQRELGGVDQLAQVEAESALLVAQDALEATRISQFLKYAELQANAGGAWKWLR